MFEAFADTFRQPFRSDMDWSGWLLFIGLLICILAFWRLIFRHLEIV